jgi:hypothetical protein
MVRNDTQITGTKNKQIIFVEKPHQKRHFDGGGTVRKIILKRKENVRK